VNGGGGVLFNTTPTVDGIRAIGAAHRRFGTTAFLPTLISDGLDVMARAIAAVDAAIEAGVPGVLGAHLQGPFISVARRGAHEAATLRRLTDDDVDGLSLLTSLRRGRTLVTLAPEVTTPVAIGRLVRAGVIVWAGHTDATAEVAEEAFASGITGVTHLFNAMSPLTSRAPGVVGAALTHPACRSGVIVDGRHVDPRTLRIALRARPLDRFMLVTDAMPSVGATASAFLLQGKRITVKDGVCVDEAGILSGAHLDMAGAVRNSVRMLGLDLADAVRMASEYPAAFLGLGAELGRIAAGCRANFVLADDDLRVRETWIDGQREMYPAPASEVGRGA
jgi:N-acetylglucosamine-6-phosphate deacetylase